VDLEFVSNEDPSRRSGPAPVEVKHRVLGEHADRYRDLVGNSQDLLCLHDLQGRLLSVNRTPARVLGSTVEERLQVPMRELGAPDFRDRFDNYMEQIAKPARHKAS
jgi:PAS domain S-box-containing protein